VYVVVDPLADAHSFTPPACSEARVGVTAVLELLWIEIAEPVLLTA
jgi:hypothetical protein